MTIFKRIRTVPATAYLSPSNSRYSTTLYWSLNRVRVMKQGLQNLAMRNNMRIPLNPCATKPGTAPTTSHLNVVVHSPSLQWGGSKWLVDSPRVSSSGDSLSDNSSHFLSLLSNARSHVDSTLKPNWPPPYPFYFLSDISSSSLLPPQTSSLLIPLTADSYLYASPYQRWHSPQPCPIDPCSVCFRRVTWGNRSIQCSGCSLWVHLSCSGLSPLTSAKSPRDTLGLAQCAHPLLNPFPPSHTLIPYLHSFLYLHPLTLQIPHLHSQTTTKPYLQKLNPPPKQPRLTPFIFLITPN